jgi:hypothetical protein
MLIKILIYSLPETYANVLIGDPMTSYKTFCHSFMYKNRTSQKPKRINSNI